MIRILFVDDEQHILDGLQNLLRKQRGTWDMVFAQGGAAALQEIDRLAFDVVVSDMRMPGMDGPTFLAEVRRRTPAAARIILSGHADRDMVTRSIGVSHQFLSKPCDAATLRRTIDRTAHLCTTLSDPTLRERLGDIDRLPALSKNFRALDRAVRDPESTAATIASIIEQDPAFCVKVLQVVNSAYFGLPQRITSAQKAVTYLGFDLMRGLALSTSLFASDEGRPSVPGLDRDQLQRHSIMTGRLALQFVSDPEVRDQALMGGIVHELGRVALAEIAPAALAKAISEARRTRRPDYEVEREVMGVSYTEVGAYLVSLWGLPHGIVETVAYHRKLPESLESDDRTAIVAVHVADVLSHRMMSEDHDERVQGLDLAGIERLRLSAEIARWEAIADAWQHHGDHAA